MKKPPARVVMPPGAPEVVVLSMSKPSAASAPASASSKSAPASLKDARVPRNIQVPPGLALSTQDRYREFTGSVQV